MLETVMKERGNPGPVRDGRPDWSWPDHNGAVSGTESVRVLEPGERVTFDRIGDERGEYFSTPDTRFTELALPPDRLAYPRDSYTLDMTHADIVDGLLEVESSAIAPGFGQPGGGTQFLFFFEGKVMKMGQMCE